MTLSQLDEIASLVARQRHADTHVFLLPGDCQRILRLARAMAWLADNHGDGICVGTLFASGATAPTWEVTDAEGESHGQRPTPTEAIESAMRAGKETRG